MTSTQRIRALALWSVLLSIALIAPPPLASCSEPDDDDDGVVTDEIFLELRPNVSIDDVVARYDVTPLESIPQFLMWRVRVAEGGSAEAIACLMEDDDVEPELVKKAEPHRLLDTPEGVQRSIPDLDYSITFNEFENQTAAVAINTSSAQEQYTGAGLTIAVLDTGVALDHPDLGGRILGPGADFAGGDGTAASQPNGLDDDGDGDVDEGLHHGTFVAGLIHLVAPDAEILPVRVLDSDGNGTAFGLAKGIQYAMQRGVDVINLSLGMQDESLVVDQAIDHAEEYGIVFVAAAGNSAAAIVDFPAEEDDVIAVGAVDASFVRTDFSNFGEELDLSAPGDALLSTFADEDFARWSGTSFATPLVSGAVALLLEKYPGLTSAEIRALLAPTLQPDNTPSEMGGPGPGVLDLEALTLALASDLSSVGSHETATGTVLTWSPVVDTPLFDVVRGDVRDLRIENQAVRLGPVSCVGNDLPVTDTTVSPDGETPPSGRVFFYVIREDPIAEEGYGAGTDELARLPDSGDCAVGE